MTDPRELKRQYLETVTRAGVYAIRIPATGATLVEGALNVDAAINRHRFELRQGNHRNPLLRAQWTAHGEAGVLFEVLDRVKPRDDPSFDVARELQALVALWREELGAS